jgi:hypothetical protein
LSTTDTRSNPTPYRLPHTSTTANSSAATDRAKAPQHLLSAGNVASKTT